MKISETLRDQYDHSWKMLADGLDKCPESQWKTGVDDPFFVPARLAFHVIQTVDFYTGSTAAEFDWKAFGFDWEESSTEELPDKDEVSAYLDKIKTKVGEFLDSIPEQTFLGSDEAFAPYFGSPFDRMMYALRHSHHHIGQLSLDLQRRGLPEIVW